MTGTGGLEPAGAPTVRPRATVVAVGIAALTLFDVWFGLRYDTRPRLFLASDVAFGVSFAVPGAVARHLRYRPRTGRWMLILGLVILIDTPYGYELPVGTPGRAVVTLLGEPGYWLQFALAGHLLLSYSAGRLPGRAERILVAVAYGVTAVGSALQVTVQSFGLAHPDSWFDSAFHTFRIGLWLTWIGLAIAAAGLLIRQIVHSHPRQRRRNRFAIGTAATTLLIFVIGFATLVRLETRPTVAETTLWLVYAAMAWAVVIAIPLTFFVGLIRERLAFASVSRLVYRLQRARAEDVERALGEALGDPTVRIVFPVSDGWRDVQGRPVTRDLDESVVRTPLGSPQIAVLVHDAALRDQSELLAAAAGAARMALDNALLYTVLKTQLDELSGSRQRLAAAIDTERQRLERDLHHGAQQRLLSITDTLTLIRSRTTDHVARTLVEELTQEVDDAAAELREIARGLRPAVLADQGLAGALAALSRRAPVDVRLDPPVPDRFTPIVEATAYYVVSEALQNVVKHADGSSARVHTSRTTDRLIVEVSDTGPGGARERGGTGLLGLDDRVSALGGRLTVDSPPRGGTRLRAEIPLDSNDSEPSSP